MPTEDERQLIDNAIREKKAVIIIGSGNYKIRINYPRDKAILIVREP